VVVDISPQKVLDDPMTPTDFSMQQMLGEMLREQLGEPGQEPTLPTKQRALALARWLLALLAAALAASWLAKQWRRAAPRFARERALPRVGYRAALDRLAELGVRRGLGETRERFAARAELAPASARSPTSTARRAGLARGAAPAARSWRRGRELHRSAPVWRRALAFLDPSAGGARVERRRRFS
jgi:hypothetical protein